MDQNSEPAVFMELFDRMTHLHYVSIYIPISNLMTVFFISLGRSSLSEILKG